MTSHEVTIKAGISYRQLDVWVRAGIIPNVDRLLSSDGVPREWQPDECAFVMRLARLVRAGIKIRLAAAALHRQTTDGRLPDVIRVGGEGVEIVLWSLAEQAVSA